MSVFLNRRLGNVTVGVFYDMEELTTTAIDVAKHDGNQSVVVMETDVTILATSHIMFKIGE